MFIYPMMVAVIVFSLPLTIGPRGGLALHMGAVLCVVLVLWLLRNANRMGIAVGEDDIIVFGPFTAKRIAWNDIAGFSTHRWSMNRIVDLKLVDGQTLNTNLVQGAAVTWSGGKTSDVLSVLQDELNSRGALR